MSHRLLKPPDWPADVDLADAPTVTARVAAEFDGWAPEPTALITDSDPAPVLRRLHGVVAMPTGSDGSRRPCPNGPTPPAVHSFRPVRS